MIGIIDEHNLLTGYRLVIFEYLLVGLLFGGLGAPYVTADRPLDAAIWLGMSANCAVILILAGASVRGAARDYGTMPLRHKRFRQMVLASHPRLWRRTVILVLLAFTPFALVGLVVCEAVLDAARGIPSSRQMSVDELTEGDAG